MLHITYRRFAKGVILLSEGFSVGSLLKAHRAAVFQGIDRGDIGKIAHIPHPVGAGRQAADVEFHRRIGQPVIKFQEIILGNERPLQGDLQVIQIGDAPLIVAGILNRKFIAAAPERSGRPDAVAGKLVGESFVGDHRHPVEVDREGILIGGGIVVIVHPGPPLEARFQGGVLRDDILGQRQADTLLSAGAAEFQPVPVEPGCQDVLPLFLEAVIIVEPGDPGGIGKLGRAFRDNSLTGILVEGQQIIILKTIRIQKKCRRLGDIIVTPAGGAVPVKINRIIGVKAAVAVEIGDLDGDFVEVGRAGVGYIGGKRFATVIKHLQGGAVDLGDVDALRLQKAAGDLIDAFRRHRNLKPVAAIEVIIDSG